MTKCPRCRGTLEAPRELAEGLPGIKYERCEGCGYTRAVTTKPRKVRLPKPTANTEEN